MTSEDGGALNRTRCLQSWLASSLLLPYNSYLIAEFGLDGGLRHWVLPQGDTDQVYMPKCLLT